MYQDYRIQKPLPGDTFVVVDRTMKLKNEAARKFTYQQPLSGSSYLYKAVKTDQQVCVRECLRLHQYATAISEAEKLKNIECDSMVRILDFQSTHEKYYVVQELCDKSLEAWVSTNLTSKDLPKPLTEEEIKTVLYCMLVSLAEIKKLGHTVYCLKPSDFLLQRYLEGRTPKYRVKLGIKWLA